MPSTAVTAAALYTGNPLQIFKGTSGLILIRDYSPANIAAQQAAAVAAGAQFWTPLDSASGNFIGGLKAPLSGGGYGYQDLGGFDENGIEFDRKNTMTSDKWMQSPDIQREDVSERSASFMVTTGQLTPAVDRINALLPLSGAPTYGTAGYTVAPDTDPTTYEYDAMVIAVDKKYGIVNRVVWFPRCNASNPDKDSYSRKASTTSKLTFDSLVDPTIGRPYLIYMDGLGWRSGGGVTATPGGTVAPTATPGTAGKATLAFAPPASGNGPFSYSVFATVAAGSPTQVPASDVTLDPSSTATNVVLDLTGLAAGSTTFQVSATGANLSTSALSLASTAVTIVS